METLSVVGKRIPRLDSARLATGKVRYATDMKLPGMLYAKVLRSKFPHARITRIDTSMALKLPGVAAVITAGDVPNNLSGIAIRDKPILASDKVRCMGDMLAAVAARDEATAEQALQLIGVQYEELPGVFDVVAALEDGAPLVHEDKRKYPSAPFLNPPPNSEDNNLSTLSKLYRGDVEQGFREADYIVEDSFSTHFVEHASMEPHGAIANVDPTGKVTIWCSTGKPFRTQMQIAMALGLPLSKLTLVQTHTGGDFGGKGETTIEPICAILAAKTGRPVKTVYSREDEFTSSTVRIPFKIKAKVGATRDGRLTALQMHMLLDIGPYNVMGGMIARWATVASPGPYDIPNVKIDAHCVYTNNLMGGAYRGFGNPQVSFAREVLLDRMAEALGLSPVELRLKNVWQPGSTMATGQVLDPARFAIGVGATLQRIQESTSWFADAPGVQRAAGSARKRGRGLASAVHGSGYAVISGSDFSSCTVKVNFDGSASLITGSTDVGQGSDTALTQIVAEELGLTVEDIALAPKDTDGSPYDAGTAASRVLYFVGNAARLAAADAKRQLFDVVADKLEANRGDLEARERKIFVKGSPDRAINIADAARMAYGKGAPPIGNGSFSQTGGLLDENGQGNPLKSILYASQAAEVEVDTETGQVDVLKVVAAHDIGRAINPLIVEGQLEGGLVNGLGFVLSEDIVVDRGKVLNPTFKDYRLPTAEDVPELQVEMVEVPEPTGPFQAKGVGEPGQVPTAAAIANAIYDAVGVRINDLPITPEKVLLALRRNAAAET